MIRILIGLIITAAGLFAQFDSLVTNSDGSHVVFSSSLSLKTEPAYDWPKLYEATTAGIQLLEVRYPASPPPPLPGGQTFYVLRSQDQSSDGSVQALNTYRPCSGGSRCVFVEVFRGEIRAPGWPEPLKRDGLIRLSANGRYAFSYGSTQFNFPPAILDLLTGRETTFQPLPDIPSLTNHISVAPPGPRVIANNGTAVYVSDLDGSVMLTSRGGEVTAARNSMPAASAIIDTEGRFVIYETAAAPHQLVYYDVISHSEFPLVQADEGCTRPVLSDEGRHLLFLSAANWAAMNDLQLTQVWLLDLATGELSQLTRDPAGVTEAVLSGDGQAAWAVTQAGTLLRVDVRSGNITELVGRSINISYRGVLGTPGSQYSLMGQGLAPAIARSTPPLPLSLGGIELKADGLALPLVSVAPNEIRFVIPWDLPPGQYRLEVTPGDTTFQQLSALGLAVTEIRPVFYPMSNTSSLYDILALHEDFQRTVTDADPAIPGELVHLYASGWGPVAPAVPTGMPAPLDPPAETVTAMTWSLRDGYGDPQPVEVLFTGLAPGQIGVYQADIRLPATLAHSDCWVTVSFDASTPPSPASSLGRFAVLPNTPNTPPPVTTPKNINN